MKLGHKHLAKEISYSLLQEARDKGFTKEDLAEYLGLTPRTVQDYTVGHGVPAASIIFGVWKLIKPYKTLKKLALYSDCLVFKVPNVNKDKLPRVAKLTAQIMKETSDVIDGVAVAIEDGKLTRTEKLRLIDEVNEALDALLKLRAYMED